MLDHSGSPDHQHAAQSSPAPQLNETPRKRTVSADRGDEHDDRDDGGRGRPRPGWAVGQRVRRAARGLGDDGQAGHDPPHAAPSRPPEPQAATRTLTSQTASKAEYGPVKSDSTPIVSGSGWAQVARVKGPRARRANSAGSSRAVSEIMVRFFRFFARPGILL